ncbi:hypothetical protein [Falsiruegeria mediterranea]
MNDDPDQDPNPTPLQKPDGQPAQPAPAPEPQAQPPSLRERIAQLASLIKDAGVITGVILTPLILVIALTWTGVIRPWLAQELLVEYKDKDPKKDYQTKTGQMVVSALADYNDEVIEKWMEHNGPIIETLNRAPDTADIEAVFENPKFKTVFLEQVLLALLKEPDKVNSIMQEYADEDLIEAWLHKEIAKLSHTVEKQVDEVHVRRLYFKPNNDDPETPFSNTRDRFYASKTQLYSIEVEINAFDHFSDDIFQKNRNLFVQLGHSDPIIVSNGGMTPKDVTCKVYNLLTAESGFVSVGSGVVEADGRTRAPMPLNGFDITVIVAARKGRRTEIC